MSKKKSAQFKQNAQVAHFAAPSVISVNFHQNFPAEADVPGVSQAAILNDFGRDRYSMMDSKTSEFFTSGLAHKSIQFSLACGKS